MSNDKTIYIYQDADLSNHSESSIAIQRGIEVAFAEVDNKIGEYTFAFKYLNHRGNVIRSKRNYQTFISDPNALAIFSGIHSPPLIKNRSFINNNKALTLVPWAAGGPITRHPSKENWIFRLSVDDTRAAPVIIDYALKNKACKTPHLLFESSSWGDSNIESMSHSLSKFNVLSPNVSRFSWNLKAKGAYSAIEKIINDGSDCIILVGNSVEGAVIAKAMLNFPKKQRLPIISHWGITGGNFQDIVTAKMRKKLDLHFIQSCFSFTTPELSPYASDVFSQLITQSKGEITQPNELKSAVGFIHAYDLSKLLIQAIKNVGLAGNINKDRDAIRMSLENLKSPIKGLIKTYTSPFSVFDEKNNINGHEALNKSDYCMGRFGEDDEVIIHKSTP